MSDFINSFEGLDATGKILGLLGKNQSTITNNIANMQTPGYVRKETNFQEVIGSMRSPILTDQAERMGPCPMVEEDGGKVVLETELMNMQKNFIFYNMVSRRASSLITTIKAVAQVGR